jgi:hypothetical protein
MNSRPGVTATADMVDVNGIDNVEDSERYCSGLESWSK